MDLLNVLYSIRGCHLSKLSQWHSLRYGHFLVIGTGLSRDAAIS